MRTVPKKGHILFSTTDDANYTEWMAWEACPRTCGPDKRRKQNFDTLISRHN